MDNINKIVDISHKIADTLTLQESVIIEILHYLIRCS